MAFLSAVYLDARILLNIKVLHFLLLSQGNIFDVLKLDLLIWVLILVIEDFLWIENTGNRFGIKNIFSLWYLINFIFLSFTNYWSIVFNLRVLRNSFLWSFRTLLCVSIHFIVLFHNMVFCFLETTVMLNFYLFNFLDLDLIIIFILFNFKLFLSFYFILFLIDNLSFLRNFSFLFL